ncbi:hypothetical protein SEPCBS119000_000771 [Sporothrix epigloea]|uniref:Uncharacterized protein n=1 Tax=Sporothrix epigloea TaxID=1892477 RepID=A0ABP0D723_9PEZI
MTTIYREGQTSTPTSIASKPTVHRPQSQAYFEKLSLQVSLWPTFTQAELPGIRVPGKPKVHNGRNRGKGKARDIDLLEQITEDERWLHDALRKAKNRSEWRRVWHNLQQRAEALTDAGPEYSTRSGKTARRGKTWTGKTDAAIDSRTHDPRVVLRQPHRPAPLPPCLQCILAGTCCSLTIRPYAKAFVNDSVYTRQSRAAPFHVPRLACDATSLKRVRLSTTANVEPFSSDPATTGSTWQQQRLEQRMLRGAVAQGWTDSPLLPQPPVQCARCEHMGERACLQQSFDVANALTSAATGHKQVTAWFASSGPPPLSLLPQHNVALLDQMRPRPEEGLLPSATDQQSREPGKRLRSQNTARPTLEAIFCRDPDVMVASEVAERAQAILKRIARDRSQGTGTVSRFTQTRPGNVGLGGAVPGCLKYRGQQKRPRESSGSVCVRPATKVEVSRLLPRRSWMNVYTGRGVATASVLPSANFTGLRTAARPNTTFNSGSGAYQTIPRAVSTWQVDGEAAAAVASEGCKRQDFFLDVAEHRAALQFHRSKQKRRQKPVATHSHCATEAAVQAELETKGERQARIKQLALLLEDQILERYRKAAELKHAALSSQGQCSPKDEAELADLIDTLTDGLNPEQARHLAMLLSGPAAVT